MDKKPNPWVQALQKKKAAVDLHPDVLRAVLKMNPDMRADNRSTEEMAQILASDLPQRGGQQPAPTAFSDDKFRGVFAEMLNDFAGALKTEMVSLEQRRKALEDEDRRVRAGYVDRVVEFLAEVQPGPLSESAREVLGEYVDLMRQLKTETSDLNRRVRERSAAFSVKR